MTDAGWSAFPAAFAYAKARNFSLSACDPMDLGGYGGKPIRHGIAVPLWRSGADGRLGPLPAGKAWRWARADAPHRDRHLTLGAKRGAIAATPAARDLWSPAASRRGVTLHVCEGITDYLTVAGRWPGAAVIGIPGTLAPADEATIGCIRARPAHVRVYSDADAPGRMQARCVAMLFRAIGCGDVQIVYPKGGAKDIAQAINREYYYERQ